MASLKKAVEAKCKDCIYDPAVGGTWREQVELCTSEKSCALWPVRPKTTATINLHRKSRDAGSELNLDALVDGLEDEDDEVTDPVA